MSWLAAIALFPALAAEPCGEPEACWTQAKGLLDTDPAAARAALEIACTGDVDAACVTLGHLLAGGSGGPPDPERATALFEPRCEAGDPAACRGLGLLQRDFGLLEDACNDGDLPSCVAIGDYLLDRARQASTAADYRRHFFLAVRGYSQACQGGLLLGCSKFAEQALVKKDGHDPEAIADLRTYCTSGEAYACGVLEQLQVDPAPAATLE